MLHPEQYEEQIELEIPYEPALKKKNYLKKVLATSFFEIVFLSLYLKYD